MRGFLRSFAAILLMSMVAAPPALANSISVSLGGVPITLSIPDGFCQLDEANPIDKRSIDSTRQSLAGQNNIYLFAADCRQLDEWRSGTRKTLDDFVQVQAPIAYLNQEIGTPQMRSEFVASVCTYFRNSTSEQIAALGAEIKARVESASPLMKVNETQILGVMSEDATGCYAAMVQKMVTEHGDEKTVSGVIAAMVLSRRIVFLYHFGNGANEATINRLHQSAVAHSGVLITANP